MHFSPLRKSFPPSRRHCLHLGSELFAITPLHAPSGLLPVSDPASIAGLGVYMPHRVGTSSSLASNSVSYTRRFLGGLHPLCGMGVTSLIMLTSRPTA